MVNISIRYEGDLHCLATHTPSGTQLATDAPKDNQGRGESFSPTDLVATALATCMMTTMGIVARRSEINLDGAAVSVDKEMSATPPRRIARLPVVITLPAHLTPEQRASLEATARACPVHHALHPDIDRPITFNYV